MWSYRTHPTNTGVHSLVDSLGIHPPFGEEEIHLVVIPIVVVRDYSRTYKLRL